MPNSRALKIKRDDELKHEMNPLRKSHKTNGIAVPKDQTSRKKNYGRKIPKIEKFDIGKRSRKVKEKENSPQKDSRSRVFA